MDRVASFMSLTTFCHFLVFYCCHLQTNGLVWSSGPVLSTGIVWSTGFVRSTGSVESL